jgi:hypothetical protein
MSKANLLVGVSVGLLVLTSAALGIAEVTNRAVKPKPNPDPRIEERQAKAGMRFIPADEPTKVTAEEARDRATSSVQADLERSATDFTVELVRFSHDRPGADGQPIALWDTGEARRSQVQGWYGSSGPKCICTR